MSMYASCRAVFIAAPASGQGKTTITAGLARLITREGQKVRVFKTGPDYLDPQVLAQASGAPVEPLDMWMAGATQCERLLYQAATDADIILIEGAMGLFDGEPSSADLAARFNIPVALIMDVKGMAQTAAAIAAGLANFREDFKVLGLIANNCGSDRHRQLIEDALPDELPLLATVKRTENITLPERHLGLVQADEVADKLEHCFDSAADLLAHTEISAYLSKLEPVSFCGTKAPRVADTLRGKAIAVAKDKAFSFIYASNIQILRDMGASVTFFSPLNDTQLPDADALWLAGGYPELYAQELEKNHLMRDQIKAFHRTGKPILAECGGFLYCMETLTDLRGDQYTMAGLMAGHGAMRGKRGCQGMQTAPLPEGQVRGHAHHRSRCDDTPQPFSYGVRQRHSANGEPVFRVGSLTASYLHLFFPSNPNAIGALFSGDSNQLHYTKQHNEVDNVS